MKTADLIALVKSRLPVALHGYVDAWVKDNRATITAALKRKVGSRKKATVEGSLRLMTRYLPRDDQGRLFRLRRVSGGVEIRGLVSGAAYNTGVIGVSSLTVPGGGAGTLWVDGRWLAKALGKGSPFIELGDSIKVGGKRIHSEAQPSGEMWDVSLEELEYTTTVPASDAGNWAYLLEAISTDVARPALTAVHLAHPKCPMSPIPEGAVSGWSTDGHRLFWTVLARQWSPLLAMGGSPNSFANIDGNIARLMHAMMQRGDLDVSADRKSIVVANGGLTVGALLAAVAYPPVCEVIKIRGRKINMTVDARELREAITQARTISPLRVDLTLCRREGENLCVSASNPDIGEFSTYIDVAMRGPERDDETRGFNPNYILDTIKGIDGMVDVQWTISDDRSSQPMTIYTAAGQRAAVIMPMRN